MKLPYGESNFKTVIEEGYFYQDRSMFIRELEDKATKYLFYLRPRRFGKSLFVSMLYYYYGLEHKDLFNDLFGKLDIGKQPTPLANQYLVLKFEFSRIDTDTFKGTFEGFQSNVLFGVQDFFTQYGEWFTEVQQAEILSKRSPNEVLKSLFSFYKKNKITYPIYILIDEYDHFANELISFNFKYFEQSVTKNGFVRKFYETIKTATWEGIVKRMFVTGVSPLTLDSMTSGFNISSNVSLWREFHALMGFEEPEVKKILQGIGVPENELLTTLDDLRAWYDGYLFNIKAKNHIYNPDMVLFFAIRYQSDKAYPDQLLDPNIATDYSKIQKLFKIQGREEAHLTVLDTLINSGSVNADLTMQFSLERKFSNDNLVSLLFYMGFLTIKEQTVGGYVFRFPNYVIERLYADYFVEMLQQQQGLPIDSSQLNFALREMALKGTPQYLYDEVSKILQVLSTCDAQGFTENSLKAIFISLLKQQQFYYVHSEYESQRQYVDIFLETIRGHGVKFEVAFELKYVKKDKDIDLEAELAKAEIQLMNYMISKKFIERPALKAYVVLVHGTVIHSREMDLNIERHNRPLI